MSGAEPTRKPSRRHRGSLRALGRHLHLVGPHGASHGARVCGQVLADEGVARGLEDAGGPFGVEGFSFAQGFYREFGALDCCRVDEGQASIHLGPEYVGPAFLALRQFGFRIETQ
jgi:hypothetical protein